MNKRGSILAVIAATLFLWCFSSCEDDDAKNANVIEKITFNAENKIMGEATKMKGDAHTGDVFSRLDQNNSFGLGYSMTIPEPYINKSITVIVDGWFRTNASQSKACIVVSPSRKDSMLSWNPMWLANSVLEPNTWCHFRDSLTLPANFNGINPSVISVFQYLTVAGSEQYDLDDFNVTYKAQ